MTTTNPQAVFSPRPLIADLIDATAEITYVCRAKLVGPSRLGQVSRARKVIYYLASQHGHARSEIGRRLGGIDHSSVTTGRRVAMDLLVSDPDFAATVAEVEARAYSIGEQRRARMARLTGWGA